MLFMKHRTIHKSKLVDRLDT